MAKLITTKWQTIAIVGFTGSVSDREQNRAAHGCVCLLQARKGANGGVIGRKVNSNGQFKEVGKAYDLDARILAQWDVIAKGNQ